MTIAQYAMPADDGFRLMPAATYLLPVTGSYNSITSMDIAPASTLLWMVAYNQASPCSAQTGGLQMHCWLA